MEIIYGSTAAKYYFDEYRDPNDLDIIGEEYDWIPAFNFLNNYEPLFLEPEYLYTIKLSHACYDINFDKTIKDILFFRNKGLQYNKEFLDLLRKDWSFLHKDKKINLNTTNQKFFTSRITRKINHDQLHEILMFTDEPFHVKIRYNKDSQICSEFLFNQLTFDEKILCAQEELLVIATERFVFNKVPFKHARYLALKLLIINLTKNWFSDFLILNFDSIMNVDIERWKQKLKPYL